MVSFCCAKLLSFIRSHWFLCMFIVIILGGGSNRMLLWFMSKSILSMFSSRSFIVSGLPFKSLIHFEFNFVYGVRECSHFVLLIGAVWFSQHHFLKRLSFLHCMFLPPWYRLVDHRCLGLFLGFSILFHWLYLCFCHYHTVVMTSAL